MNTSAHWFGFEGHQAIYCRRHGGNCWAKAGKKNDSNCPQKFGWISNPILRFLLGWLPA